MKNTGKRFEIVDKSLLSPETFLTNNETGDNFFVEEVDDKLLLFRWPKDNRLLNYKIYSSPSAYPIIGLPKNIISTETCFSNVYSPTPSYVFNCDDGFVYNLESKLSYNDYINLIDQEIDKTIIDTYNTFDTVHLMFSGGSDSLVLLSYIIKNNLLKRTIIVTAENTAVNISNIIPAGDQRKTVLHKLLDWLKCKALDVHYHEITKTDLLKTINTGNVWQLKSYSTHYMFNYYKNSAMLLGVKGNNTLLHRAVIAGQVMRCTGETLNGISDSNLFYTKDLCNYDYLNDNVDIQNRFLAKKGYYKFNGMNGNTMIYPFGSDNMFRLLRSIDWTDLRVNIIADALLPRYLIDKNAGKYLNEYITYENCSEWDNMDGQDIDIDLINSNVLKIPDNLNHNDRGMGYINQELKKVYTMGKINLNLILSFKSLQMISDKFNNELL